MEKKRPGTNWRSLAGLAAALVIVCGCQQQPPQSGAIPPTDMEDSLQMERWTAESLTLRWDPPEEVGGGYVIASYELFYRVSGDEGWHLLKRDIAATDSPSVTIRHSEVGNGHFEFAVRSIDTVGMKSDFHTSRDSSASPGGGWYCTWEVR